MLEGVRGIAFTDFQSEDVVRHPLVQAIVDAYERARPQAERDGAALAVQRALARGAHPGPMRQARRRWARAALPAPARRDHGALSSAEAEARRLNRHTAARTTRPTC